MKIKTDLLLILVILASTALFFQSLLRHLGTGLIDWFDYPYYVWTIYQNINHFSSLQFSGFFTTNAFFPLEGTLLFSDLLLPQSVIAWTLSHFLTNFILVFNLTFLLTLFMNGIAIYFFWNQIFKQKNLVFTGSILLTFSPYFFSQLSHFQMISYWPTFFVLGLLFQQQNSLMRSIIIGIFLVIQFLASVYLFVFLATICFIWYLFKFQDLKFYLVSLLIFSLCAFPFVRSYLQVRDSYKIFRDYGEYVTYSAQITDYIFTMYQTSTSSSTLGKKWNQYNNHRVGEPATSFGMLVSTLMLVGVFSYKKSKSLFSISFKTTRQSLFFLTILALGFLFSLGPKLSVNGYFTGIPLPYAVLLKFFPVFEPIRATSRWSFLFYIGATYFAILGLQKLTTKLSFKTNLLLNTLVLAIFVLEVFPIKTKYETKFFSPTAYQKITELCHNSTQVLLEYPLNQTSMEANVATNLSYKTTQLLSSLSHSCKLVNGYAGYDPEEYQYFESQLSQALTAEDRALFFETMRKQNVDIIKLNKSDLAEKSALITKGWLKSNSQLKILFEDEKHLVVQLLN